MDEFQAITPSLLKEFMVREDHSTTAVRNEYHRMIRKFLIFLFRKGLHPQADLYLSLSVGTVLGEHIVTVLTDNEKDQLKYYKENSATPLALRDAAMLELGLKMGLRSCDIANLRLTNIDWQSRSICLIQEKTNVAIRLPMPNSVGNAIYRYLKSGRPTETKYDHVFLKVRAPYGPVCSAECRHAIRRALPNMAGAKFHITRRTFATDLLRSGAQAPIIADLLGHSSMASVHKYLSLDEERMRLCSLSLAETGLLMKRRSLDD